MDLHHEVMRTKLYKPKVRKDYIKRHALIAQLEQSVSLPFTLVSAATGCGKSVSISQWLDESGHKYGWLSLDEEHNNIHVFITYLNALLKDQWPGKSFGIESFLSSTNVSTNLIISTLTNDLDQLNDFFVLVLDDYHLIREPKIHEVINGILNYPTDKMHLVIITQMDPPLKLARMRAQRRLNELRMKDLSFSYAEALELRNLIGVEIPDEQINLLTEKVEGWITGISVGLMGLAQGVEIDKIFESLDGQNAIISQLLEEVILEGLSISTQKFLVLSSLVDQFSEETLAAMAGALNDDDLPPSGSKAFMSLSKKRNFFLVPLDAKGYWFRYHHFFRSQIKERAGQYFSQDEINNVYKAASQCFEDQQLLEAALKYAILSEDIPFAVDLFDKHRLSLQNKEQFLKLERLINQFPEAVVQQQLPLLLNLAILQDHKANFSGMQRYLEQAEILLDAYQPKGQNYLALKGQFHAVSSFMAFMKGDFEGAIGESEVSLELLPANEPNYFREYALAYFSMAQQAIGQKDFGLAMIKRTLESQAKSDKYFKGRLLHIETLIHSLAGDARQMAGPGMHLERLFSGTSYPSAWMAGLLGVISSAYISNDLESVHRFHDALFKYRYTGRPFGVIHHFFIECLASMALSDWDKVDACIAKCHDLAAEVGIAPLAGSVYAFEIEAALSRGNVKQAGELAALADFEPHPPIWYYYIPQLTKVKLLFYREDQEKAFETLNDLIEQGRMCHNENLLIQALALQAVLLKKRGDHRLALSVLEEALILSANKDHVRTFVNYGEDIGVLLEVVSKERLDPEQVNKIKQAIIKTPPRQRHDPPKKVSRNENRLLSKREQEILRLVAEGHRNDTIADQICVSLDTVKKHLYNAY
ncbi:MAG: LuxR C-terminal-related transcriptional regulator, partial [Eudoraea sp.]|nr:LuxR C-terminal-related transcriptional regulator [Eudoraea sp.]